MSVDNELRIVGHLTADPELRHTKSGAPVANFTVAQTKRFFDREANEWKDGPSVFVKGTVWRDAAENAAETLRKGMRVIVTGSLLPPEVWTTNDGEARAALVMEVDEVGPALKNATAVVTKNRREDANEGRPTRRQRDDYEEDEAPRRAPARKARDDYEEDEAPRRAPARKARDDYEEDEAPRRAPARKGAARKSYDEDDEPVF